MVWPVTSQQWNQWSGPMVCQGTNGPATSQLGNQWPSPLHLSQGTIGLAGSFISAREPMVWLVTSPKGTVGLARYLSAREG